MGLHVRGNDNKDRGLFECPVNLFVRSTSKRRNVRFKSQTIEPTIIIANVIKPIIKTSCQTCPVIFSATGFISGDKDAADNSSAIFFLNFWQSSLVIRCGI